MHAEGPGEIVDRQGPVVGGEDLRMPRLRVCEPACDVAELSVFTGFLRR